MKELINIYNIPNSITHYETYRPQTNPRNPNPWESVKRFDGCGESHLNPVLSMDMETPHMHDLLCPGKVRKPYYWELPRN